MRPKLLMENDYILRQCVGIDVSKDVGSYHVYVPASEEAHYSSVKTFKNNKTGFNQLVKWSRKEAYTDKPLRYVMAATGVYHEELVTIS